jgi:hypothetical protein
MTDNSNWGSGPYRPIFSYTGGLFIDKMSIIILTTLVVAARFLILCNIELANFRIFRKRNRSNG